MKIQYSCDEKTLGGSNLAIHKDSHTISKEKPKIRIIHIVAPEIIKTDAGNFRSLVQKLTGKSSGSSKKKGKSLPSLQKKKIKKKDNQIPNAFLSFVGDGNFMHGMNIKSMNSLYSTSDLILKSTQQLTCLSASCP